MTITKTSKAGQKAAPKKGSAGNILAVKRQLRRSRPVFKRHGAHRKAELSERWKKPRGLHNKLKDNKRGCGPVVGDGYRTPESVRGYHISGLMIVHAANVQALQGVDAATHGVVISRVGAKKQLDIIAAAQAAGIRVLNHNAEARAKELTARFTQGKKAREDARASKKVAETKSAKKGAAKAKAEESSDKDEDAVKTAEEKAKKEVLTSKNQ